MRRGPSDDNRTGTTRTLAAAAPARCRESLGFVRHLGGVFGGLAHFWIGRGWRLRGALALSPHHIVILEKNLDQVMRAGKLLQELSFKTYDNLARTDDDRIAGQVSCRPQVQTLSVPFSESSSHGSTRPGDGDIAKPAVGGAPRKSEKLPLLTGSILWALSSARQEDHMNRHALEQKQAPLPA
jgi:hypothetical protein